jgi:hypothetical protein
MTSAESTPLSDPTREMLLTEVMELLRRTGTDRLSPDMLFLLGDIDFEEILPRWADIDRLFACAKLAVVREEFSARFPSFAAETEGFTFGIIETCADRYQSILGRREPSDITDIVLEMLESLFPPAGLFRRRRPRGVSDLGIKLVALLTAYAESVEARLHPYAETFGVPAGE